MTAWPIVEVFGPTIQGEGPLAGLPTFFVRVGLCDYRCSWCDSMYAVDPKLVKAGSERLTAPEVVERVMGLPLGPQWVTLSGGNPAIHDLGELVDELHGRRLKVAVETQGSVWRPWLGRVDMLVVSPKPPSSGMATPENAEQTERFMATALKELQARRRALKVVVFDDADLAWARKLLAATAWRSYLSVGTPIPDAEPTSAILDRFRWLCETVASDMTLRHVRVLPQLHVLAWGQTRGV